MGLSTYPHLQLGLLGLLQAWWCVWKELRQQHISPLPGWGVLSRFAGGLFFYSQKTGVPEVSEVSGQAEGFTMGV